MKKYTYCINNIPPKYKDIISNILKNGVNCSAINQLFQKGTPLQWDQLSNKTSKEDISSLIFEAYLQDDLISTKK